MIIFQTIFCPSSFRNPNTRRATVVNDPNDFLDDIWLIGFVVLLFLMSLLKDISGTMKRRSIVFF